MEWFAMEMDRRSFVIAGAAMAAYCWVREVPAVAAAPSGPVEVGTVDDFKSEGVVDKFAKSNRILLIRKGDRLWATDATCTHRNCVIKPVSGELRCPCHGSRFDLAGGVTKGPARATLPRYGIALRPDGKIVVDPSQKFDPSQWEDPRSFVRMS
jgi:Rieske Fe-S protein